jgi:hypothetical protein
MRALTFVSVLLMSAPLTAGAQAPGESVATPTLAVAPSVIAVGSRVGELSSSYNDGGRRDPFGSLVAPKKSAVAAEGARPRGLAGIALADVTVRGILRAGDTMFAILEAPNRQSYTTRPKDRLLDATVVSVDAQGVTFNEQTGPGMPPSLVRKSLRPAGDEIR